MRAFVLGATGATGRELVGQLLADARYEQVEVAVRRPLGVEHPKLRVHLVDFEQPAAWSAAVQGDVLFLCMGTTLKAAENGVPTCVLVSAAMADAQSRWFYPRIKGELEEALRALPFRRLAIARPPVLDRPGSDRMGERIWVKVVRAFNALGLLRGQRPMSTAALAQALRRMAADELTGVYEGRALWALTDEGAR